jgi:predicted tellurium resistance membrane protein TerC
VILDLSNILLSLATLTILEIVLGIDNLIFLTIITQRLPREQQKRARQIGLTLAWVLRLLLLASAVWLTKLTRPLISFYGYAFSGRDLFLLIGGLFLLAKATQEIHNAVEPPLPGQQAAVIQYASFRNVIVQIAVLDIIFSLDSVLTAIGLTQEFWIMTVAITIAIITMVFTSQPLGRFVENHPTIKMLALSFLILIGMVLMADGLHFHISRGYVYFALGFSIFVEALNLVRRKKLRKIKR